VENLKAEKIGSKKISDQVAEQLEHWIRTQQLKPGDKLPSVRQLCDLFDVGRSAVRDAITTLKGKGIVEVRQGEGAFIRSFDSAELFTHSFMLNKEDVEEIFAVRKILEAGSAELAALNRTNEHLLRMEAALKTLKKSQSLNDWEADYAFHLAIAEATCNKVVIQLMKTVSGLLKKAVLNCHSLALQSKDVDLTIQKQHTAIFKAINRKRPEEARLAMLNHLIYIQSLLAKE
jgi:GntR family transcriptional repressor for pyruvate dehydrogenase complex